MDPRQLAEHLRFYQETCVTGISRDARWRSREGDAPAFAEADSVDGADQKVA